MLDTPTVIPATGFVAEGLTVRLDYVNNIERDTAAQIMQANLADATD